MTPPGMAFIFVGDARCGGGGVRCPSPYWDWRPRPTPEVFYQLFAGTPPTHHLYGLGCALDMILDEEGLEAVWRAARACSPGAVWAAVEAWGAAASFRLNIDEPGSASHAVTTIRTAPGRRYAPAALVRRRRRGHPRRRAAGAGDRPRGAVPNRRTWAT